MTRFFGGGPLLAVATVTSLAAVGIGVSLSSPAAVPPTPLAHSLSSLDTTTMAIARAPWCSRVSGVDVAAALGATDATATAPTLTAWKNGDRVRLGTITDVANEYGCTWTAGERAASAWVFAPPVTVAQAESLVTSASKADGCTSTPGAPAFGSPSVTLTCGDTVSVRGLFGDAWLVCTLTGPAADVTATLTPLAPRWCASVALAARQSK